MNKIDSTDIPSAHPGKRGKKYEYKALGGLRGLFALFIFLHHVGWFPAGGDFAVSFFLMTSGFLMAAGYGNSIDEGRFKLKRFWIRRFKKIYPLHILCLIATIAMGMWVLSIKSVATFILNLTLLQSWVPSPEVFFSGNPVAWFLADILFCYLMFPSLYRWVSSLKKADLSAIAQGRKNTKAERKALMMAVILGVYFAIVLCVPKDFCLGVVYINPLMRLMDFGIGVMLERAFGRHRIGMEEIMERRVGTEEERSRNILEKAAIGAGIIFVAFWQHIPEGFALVSWWWIPVMLLLIVFSNPTQSLIGEWLSCKAAQVAGKMSFSFFMVHYLIIQLVSSLFDQPADYPGIAVVAIAFVASVGLAYVIDRFLHFGWVRV